MNKLTTFVIGMVVGTFGFAYSELKNTKNSKLKSEDENCHISYTIDELKNGEYFIRGYATPKENK